jgi:predicted RND superfamily exporter protein
MTPVKADTVTSTKSSNGGKHGAVEQFFDTKFTNFIIKAKYVIILVCVSITAYCGIRCSEIRGLSEFEKYFSENHILTQSFYKVVGGFNSGNQG